MRILIVGAGGFIGSHLAAVLLPAGHRLVLAGRNPAALARRFPGSETMAVDFATDSAAQWLPRLADIDAVINTAGIFRDSRVDGFAAVHVAGPKALFDACKGAGIPRVIQISAQGADETAFAPFHLSKRQADNHLAALADEGELGGWIVLRPNVVFGRGGGSSALFCAIAALPRPIRFRDGAGILRPLHVKDLVDAIILALTAPYPLPRRLDLVGAESLTTDRWTAQLRSWLGLAPARFIALPDWLWRIGALLGNRLPGSLLSTDALEMLARGHAAGPEAAEAALDWRARPLAEALAADPAWMADRWQARLHFLRPMLRLGLAAIWIVTGLVSAFAYPLVHSVALVQRLGVASPVVAASVVYAGAALDLVLGVAMLLLRRPCRIGAVQLGTMLLFTLLATIASPALWIDPFGPLTKNLAVALATLAWIALENRP